MTPIQDQILTSLTEVELRAVLLGLASDYPDAVAERIQEILMVTREGEAK